MENSPINPAGPEFTPVPKRGQGGLRRDEVIEQYLLQKITSGEFAPGTKLPPTSEMAAQMEVNLNSLQKALMRLSARGFLLRKPNVGTIVAARATPSNVFLLIGPCLRDETCHFDRSLSKLIENELFSRGYNPITYDGLDQILDRNSSVGPRLRSQLLGDLAHFDPKAIVEQGFVSMRIPDLVQDRNLPVVAHRPVEQGGDVSFDAPQFYADAVGAVAERGRKNIILVLKNPKVCFESTNLRAFWKAVKDHGVTVSKILHIDDDRDPIPPEQLLTELLTREIQDWKGLPVRKRPDALILMDDILMRAASLCLLREGVSVPGDLLAVSLTNEGIDLGFGVPVIGIEVPMARIAAKLVDILDIRLGRSGGQDPSPVQIPGRIVEAGRPVPALPSAQPGPEPARHTISPQT